MVKGEKARRTFDNSSIVRNEGVDDVSESSEGASKEFDE
jgi:hypothetical protein